MVDNTPRVGEQRPGGRAARVRAAVLEATAELLMEVGYDRLSIDEVASRAGVHKTTVYRRWPTKPELIWEAVQVNTQESIPMPDTGSILTDLRAIARTVVAYNGSEGGARRTRSIVAAAAHSEELAASMHTFWAGRLAASVPVVKRAIERGELPPDTDPIVVIETLVGPIWLRLLVTGETIDDDLADKVAGMVAAGAARAEPSES